MKKPRKKKSIFEAMPKPHLVQRELWAITFFLLATFVYFCNRFPTTTGILGQWLRQSAQTLVGDGLKYLPLFLILPGLSYIFTPTKHKSIVTTVVSSYCSFVVLLEMIHFGRIDQLAWPLPTEGGGWIGAVGLFSLQKTIGSYGTLIFIAGIFLISIVLLFGISLKSLSLHILSLLTVKNKKTTKKPTLKKSPRKKGKSTQIPAWTQLKKLLFYVKVSEPFTLPRTLSTNKKPGVPGLSDVQPFQLPDSDVLSAGPIDDEQAEALEEGAYEDSIEVGDPPLSDPEPKAERPRKRLTHYSFPPLSLLESGTIRDSTKKEKQQCQERARMLEEALDSFNVKAKVINITSGPSVTRYELQPGLGVKVSKITALSKDIALKLAAPDVRIEAPSPGKSLVGIEVPNIDVRTITLKALINQTDFYDNESKLLSVMGVTITGAPIIMDLGKMPHVLIAGATGSGKSVCINTIILSILLRATPDEVKFLMIDPKKVELSLYDGIPHLLAPVVTNPNKAAATLKQWALIEMENRYEQFALVGVKDIAGYNSHIETLQEELANKPEIPDEEKKVITAPPEKIPYIVVVIDELADLMMVASHDVETTICRLAQMSRATGIHLVIATQRPTVNVITGLIKANVPSRISFFLQSQIDSRTILDMGGAEKLLGKGDMLYSPVGSFKPKRVQGVFISEAEVKNVVAFLKKQGSPTYVDEIIDVQPIEESGKKANAADQDDLYEDAKDLIINSKYASTSFLQRKLRIGYNRAARIMDELEENGVISEYVGEKKSRNVI